MSTVAPFPSTPDLKKKESFLSPPHNNRPINTCFNDDERKKNQDLSEVCIVPNHFCYYRPDVVYTTKKKRQNGVPPPPVPTISHPLRLQNNSLFLCFWCRKRFCVHFFSCIPEKQMKRTHTQERKKFLVCLKLFGLFCVSFSLNMMRRKKGTRIAIPAVLSLSICLSLSLIYVFISFLSSLCWFYLASATPLS